MPKSLPSTVAYGDSLTVQSSKMAVSVAHIFPHRSIDYYRINLFDMFDVKSKTGMVLFAARHGILPMDP
ncbi:MAG: hypothetical protein WAR83_08315 [Flavobacteriales bacterium]